jgi:biopolymer transport protein TolR
VNRKMMYRHTEGIFDPNMTPLIDVSLVLVVILMVATPMALQSSIAVSRASSSGRHAVPARVERVEVDVMAADRILVNRVEVPRAALGTALQGLLAASATRQVVVRCADDVPHGTFVGVIDEAKARGAARIAVIGG